VARSVAASEGKPPLEPAGAAQRGWQGLIPADIRWSSLRFQRLTALHHCIKTAFSELTLVAARHILQHLSAAVSPLFFAKSFILCCYHLLERAMC
jgi:hypothetical protein